MSCVYAVFATVIMRIIRKQEQEMFKCSLKNNEYLHVDDGVRTTV